MPALPYAANGSLPSGAGLLSKAPHGPLTANFWFIREFRETQPDFLREHCEYCEYCGYFGFHAAGYWLLASLGDDKLSGLQKNAN